MRGGEHEQRATPASAAARVVGAVRVLQLHTRYRQPGGEDAVVRAEADLLRQCGHEVAQYQVRNPPGAAGAAGSLALSPWNPLQARRVRTLAEQLRPDVAHVHNTWYALSPAVLWALHRAGVPTVMTLHNYRLLCANGQLFRDLAPCEDCVGAAPWPGVRHGCYRDSALLSVPPAGTIALHDRLRTWTRAVDLFLALNEFARARFIRGGLPPDRIRVKPNFVPDPGPRTRPAASSDTVLYVGRLSPEKGVDVLAEAWRRLDGGTLELVVIGDGPLQQALERRSPAGLRFQGQLPAGEVRSRMLGARALVLPSIWYEGQPMAVLEALAAGLPVLGSDIGGIPELLAPLGRDWLASPGEVASWAAGLQALTDGDRIAAASVEARALYERSFSTATAARALEAAYDQARSRRAGTGP
jgi:glycosyltransferase involved in cell wall biosynthesis